MKIKFNTVPFKLLIFLFVILVLILGTAVIKSIYLSKYPGTGEIVADLSEIEKAELPLDPKNKNVSNFYYTYTFFGEVKEVKDAGGSKQIILNSDSNNLPQFLVSEKDTKVYTVTKNKAWIAAKVLNIKPGLKISISSSYEPAKQEWKTRSVYIL